MSALFMDTTETKDENYFVINQHVACICDDKINTGVILGAIYDKKNPPSVADKNKRVTTYQDGSFVSFDKSTGDYLTEVNGAYEIQSGDLVKIYGSAGLELNGNSFGGLVKVSPTVNKLNAIENKINQLIGLISGWVPAAGDGGAALKTLLTTWASSILVTTVVANLENPNVKH